MGPCLASPEADRGSGLQQWVRVLLHFRQIVGQDSSSGSVSASPEADRGSGLHQWVRVWLHLR